MRSIVLGLVLLAACSTQENSEPDGGVVEDAEPGMVCGASDIDRCERMQTAPAECYQDECECGQRVCGNERVCQEWPDTGAFQCRVMFWCECSF